MITKNEVRSLLANQLPGWIVAEKKDFYDNPGLVLVKPVNETGALRSVVVYKLGMIAEQVIGRVITIRD